MKQTSFYQLFIEQLQDIYNAETQILSVLPKMVEAASLPELKQAFQTHLKDTQRQAQRLKKIFSHLGVTLEGKTCKGMEGLIKEGIEVINAFPSSALRDAALISAAQKVEHYEIAGYGAARTYAKHLDLNQVADLLQSSLDEEGLTNKKLTRLAEGSFFNRGINEEARKEETGLNAKKLREINHARDLKDIKKRKVQSTKKTTSGKKKTDLLKKQAAKKTTKPIASKAKTTKAGVKNKLNISPARKPTVTRTGVSKVSQRASLSGHRSPARTGAIRTSPARVGGSKVSHRGSRGGIQAKGRK